MRERHARRDMAPTPSQLTAIRRSIQRTAARFHQWLSFECIEDLMQEVLLRLWRSGAEDRLRDCPAFVRRVAENTTIDTLRSQGAKKRRIPLAMLFDPRISPWRPPHTPEEILIAREEAQHVLATNHYLQQRVRSTIRRHFPRELEQAVQ
jgi:DNA-directed RNA polymerase specialized sigma24 family protein